MQPKRFTTIHCLGSVVIPGVKVFASCVRTLWQLTEAPGAYSAGIMQVLTATQRANPSWVFRNCHTHKQPPWLDYQMVMSATNANGFPECLAQICCVDGMTLRTFIYIPADADPCRFPIRPLNQWVVLRFLMVPI